MPCASFSRIMSKIKVMLQIENKKKGNDDEILLLYIMPKRRTISITRAIFFI